MTKNKFTISVFLVCSLFSISAKAQIPPGHFVTFATILDGDTIPLMSIREVEIISSRDLLSDDEKVKYAKLIRNVKKTYPYAQTAKKKLSEYNVILTNTKDAGKRKEIMKKAEKEIEAEFGNDLKKLTFSQGKVLIKLIDRETGNSSYELVQDLRGNFRAFFYQAFAKVFGLNLKVRYNPRGDKEDEVIERIVRSIELNMI